MNHGIALSNVAVKHVERFGAGCDEVFLYLDSHVGAIKIVAQSVSITSELRAHGGKEDLHGHQRPSFLSLAFWSTARTTTLGPRVLELQPLFRDSLPKDQQAFAAP